MNKFYSFLAALAFVVLPSASSAAINQVTVNGKVNDTVRPGAAVTLNVDFDLAMGEQVESAKVEFPGSDLPEQRFNLTPDYTQPNHYNLDIRNVKIPSDTYAIWMPVVTLCGDPTSGAANNCEVGTEVFTFNMNGQITAQGTPVSGPTTPTTSTPTTAAELTTILSQYDLPPFLVQLLVNGWLAAQKPTPAPACGQLSSYGTFYAGMRGPSVIALQNFLMGSGGQAATFHGAGVYSATGFYGSVTASAVANFKTANHCN